VHLAYRITGRLMWSPLVNFPLAALTLLYEFYYDVIIQIIVHFVICQVLMVGNDIVQQF